MIGVATLPALMSVVATSIDAPVQVLEEMLGLEEVGDAVVGVVVDEDRAEQRLLGVDVVRGDAVVRRRALQAGDQGVGGRHFSRLRLG